MDDDDWKHTLAVFRACLPRRGRKAEDDRRFLEALHFFTVENVRWRALPERFGHWNSVWKRFDRLSKAGVFEAFFDTLASMSSTAHLIQMFNSTHRARACVGGRSKGGQEDQALGRSRGGFTTKIHAKSDASGDIIAFDLTGAEAFDRRLEIMNRLGTPLPRARLRQRLRQQGQSGGRERARRTIACSSKPFVQISRRHPVARSARALWRLEDRLSALHPMGQERRFRRIFRLLASDHDNEYMMIDATIVRAHQHSAGAKKRRCAKPSADPAAD